MNCTIFWLLWLDRSIIVTGRKETDSSWVNMNRYKICQDVFIVKHCYQNTEILFSKTRNSKTRNMNLLFTRRRKIQFTKILCSIIYYCIYIAWRISTTKWLLQLLTMYNNMNLIELLYNVTSCSNMISVVCPLRNENPKNNKFHPIINI